MCVCVLIDVCVCVFNDVCVCVYLSRSTRKSEITPENCRTRPALMFVLHSEELYPLFVTFCKQQHSEENVLVWATIRRFKEATEEGRLLVAQEIIRRVRSPCLRARACVCVCVCVWCVCVCVAIVSVFAL